MSFRLKMYVFTIAIVVTFSTIVALSFYGTDKEVDTLISGYNEASKLTSESKHISITFFRTVQEFKNLALRGHIIKQKTKYIDKITERREKFNVFMDKTMKDPNKDDAQISKLKEIKKLYNRQVDIYLAAPPKSNDVEINHKQVDKNAKGADRPTRKVIFEYDEMVSKKIIELKEENRAYATELLKMATVGVLAIIATIFGLSFIFIRKQVNFLNETTNNLIDSAHKVKESAQGVSDASLSLSKSSTQQASSVQETVTTLDEINSMVSRSSESSSSAKNFTNEGVNLVHEGKNNITSLLESMKEISNANDQIESQVSSSNEKVSGITTVISEIVEKTKVINDIVFQTKLLSFNASVEAARAGEHGKGFAVVAEEVGNLAQMSGKAAKEITELLESRMNLVTDIVSQNEQTMSGILASSKERINDGLTKGESCSSVFEKILRNANETNKVISDVSSASSEQSTGVNEIAKAMNEIDKSTQHNSQLANQTSDYGRTLTENERDMTATLVNLEDFINGKKAA